MSDQFSATFALYLCHSEALICISNTSCSCAMPCDYISPHGPSTSIPFPSTPVFFSASSVWLSRLSFPLFSFAFDFRHHAGNPTFCVLVMQWHPVSRDGPCHIPPDVNSNDKIDLLDNKINGGIGLENLECVSL